ncbi:spore germination lipoprotein GerD [Paenibacillus thermoaerophilus]|uniref:Spore germination lipoprotein GerD n=1 Tax=Paenibacillus thermoaerophilus TaxID=1215385 RepID=A0ABW2V1K4_9BACL|nr:spore germination lipoprotein GerD [Paenibacillus thermoaerophilus]TMV10933.1 spore gernimation protein [Paenibacillus thermoaerophilus]
MISPFFGSFPLIIAKSDSRHNRSQRFPWVRRNPKAHTNFMTKQERSRISVPTRLKRLAPVVLTSLMLASCATGGGGDSSGQMPYKDIKSMVLDIIQSQDGQQAIMKAATEQKQDPTLRLLSTGEGQQIQLAVKEILTTDTTEKLLQKTMTDPRFAGEFAKVMNNDIKAIQKELLKDPEFQKSYMQSMQNPEFEMMLLQTMRAPQFKQQIHLQIQEAMQNPLFKMEMLELVKKAIQEGATPTPETQAQSQNQGQNQDQNQRKNGQEKEEDQEDEQKQDDDEQDQQ